MLSAESDTKQSLLIQKGPCSAACCGTGDEASAVKSGPKCVIQDDLTE